MSSYYPSTQEFIFTIFVKCCSLESIVRKLSECLCFGFGKESDPLGKDLRPGSQCNGAIKIVSPLTESIKSSPEKVILDGFLQNSSNLGCM